MSRPAASELPLNDQSDSHLRLVLQRDCYAWPDIEFVGCFQLIAQLKRSRRAPFHDEIEDEGIFSPCRRFDTDNESRGPNGTATGRFGILALVRRAPCRR